MNCSIPPANMKVISKALHTLAKIGDELQIEAHPNYLQFATINQTKTGYATFNFDNMFFLHYEVNNDGTTNELSCKIYFKAVLNIFKSKGARDKMLESFKIEFDNNPQKITFKLRYKEGVNVTHNLNLIDMEVMSVSFDKETASNEYNGSGNFFHQLLNNFQSGDSDMSLEVKRNKVTVRNYDISSTNVGKNIRSQVILNANEFISYRIKEETHITLCFKPFRAAVGFAEWFNLQIVMNFGIGGRPVILIVKSPTFEGNFILATLSPDGTSQTCTNVTPSVTNISRNRGSSTNVELSGEDRTLLEDLNWDSDFDVNENDVLLNELKNKGANMDVEDIVPESPDSPKTKRLKKVFGRCFQDTFHESNVDFGKELAPNSDSE